PLEGTREEQGHAVVAQVEVCQLVHVSKGAGQKASEQVVVMESTQRCAVQPCQAIHIQLQLPQRWSIVKSTRASHQDAVEAQGHISGRLKYVHVTVDTFSSVMWASAHTGEKARDVIAHWRQAFAVLGIPSPVKTDNGPANASQQVRQFLQLWGVSHKFVRNLVTKQWEGPYDLIASGRGYACVSTDTGARWVPSKCVHRIRPTGNMETVTKLRGIEWMDPAAASCAQPPARAALHAVPGSAAALRRQINPGHPAEDTWPEPHWALLCSLSAAGTGIPGLLGPP
ncbi:hypothetical protein DV515_00019572, partial [Chloebia gouldiae]